MSFIMSWGESQCVREAFAETCKRAPFVIGDEDLKKMSYPPHYGRESLINLTRWVIERQTGRKYQHILLTNGATGGIAIALRAFKQRGCSQVLTNKPPFFPLYKTVFDAVGLEHGHIPKEIKPFSPDQAAVILLDNPSNPLGIVTQNIHNQWSSPVILDAVYYNRIYAPNVLQCNVVHDILVGSYSKLTGLNGCRVGYLATDDPLLYERLKLLVDAEYAGLSAPSMDLLLHVLRDFDWPSFEYKAKLYLDQNRTEWSKLERFFEGWPVSPIGMFHYGKMDQSLKNLMEKSGIEWLSGDICHHDSNYGRFNLGQNCALVKKAVRNILKTDKR